MGASAKGMMSTDYVVGLITRMGDAGYWVIFLAAALESAAFVGLVVPGEAVVLLAGFLASRGLFDLDALIVGIAVAAAVGDSIGYELGRRFGRNLFVRIGARFGFDETRLAGAETFFARHGPASVFVGRFVGFARALVPFLAGSTRMPYTRFALFNVAGAVCWSCTTVLVGFLAGASWRYAEGWIGHGGMIVLAALTVSWLLRRRVRLKWGLWAEVALFALAVVLFGSIAEDVVTKDALTRVDSELAQWLHAHVSPMPRAALMIVSEFHKPASLAVASLLMGIWLAFNERIRWLGFFAATMVGGSLLNLGMKALFHRARPVFDDPIVSLATYGFPSGHVAAATLFYGAILVIVLASPTTVPRKVGTTCLAAAIILTVAFSRLYLGAHYLSDVLGAFVEAVGWIVLCYAVFQGRLGTQLRAALIRWLARRRNAKPTN